MNNDTVVRVGGSFSRHVSLIIFVLMFVGSAVVVTAIFGPLFGKVLTGERPLDIIVIYPLIVFVFIGWAAFVALQAREMWNPVVFSKNQFRTQGFLCNYDRILRMHVNPSEDYMVMLYKEPIGESKTPGIVMRKNMIKPSIPLLLDTLREREVEIVEEKVFSRDDLWEMRKLQETHEGPV